MVADGIFFILNIMINFKFLNNNIPNEPQSLEGARDRFMELVNYQLSEQQIQMMVRGTEDHYNQLGNPISTDNRPAVFLNLTRNRGTISDNEWNSIIEHQRRQLIDYMWQQGMIMHTIVSEDEYGFTLRTELLF